MTLKEFVSEYKQFALNTEVKSGIDHRFILAQAALESAWGESAPGNMFFGVKAGKNTPSNKKQLLRTTEILKDEKQSHRFPEVISISKRSDGKYKYVIRDWFKKYDTPEECFDDHADFFVKNKRYHEALSAKHDPYLFADAVAAAGYATDPNYATKLKSMIQSIESVF